MKTLKFKGDTKPTYPYILGVWHQDLIAALWFFRQSNMLIMLSSSKDASPFEYLLKSMGYKIINGSSTKGFKTLRHFTKKKYQNNPIGMALDGPKGPAKIVKPGCGWISKKTQKPQLALEVKYNSYWQLNTWDKMIIPKPFSTIEINLNNLN